MNNPFADAVSFLDNVKTYIPKQDQPYLSRLEKPNSIHYGLITKNKFPAWRVQYNDALGPYKGGIRFHKGVTEEEIKALALWMSLKCSLAGLPFGGAKGGVMVNPKALSKKELEELSRAYIRFIAPHIGSNHDIPAPDVNTNSQIIAWMLDEYESIVGYKEPAVFTGKPLCLGGSEGREEATGYGGVLALQFLIERLRNENYSLIEKPISQITIAVQGFGNVGYYFAKLASEAGFRVVAVSDSKGAIYIPEGLDPVATMKCKKEKGTLAGCYCKGGVCDIVGGRQITNEELLELPVDVLVPAALEGAITEKNAKNIKAPLVIELANGPITPEADSILQRKKTMIVPDIFANSGGVIVSYFEWVQNRMGYYWTKESIDQKLEKQIRKSFQRIWNEYTALKEDRSLRLASYLVAVKKIIEAEKFRKP